MLQNAFHSAKAVAQQGLELASEAAREPEQRTMHPRLIIDIIGLFDPLRSLPICAAMQAMPQPAAAWISQSGESML
jgi:hypothetical protein